MNVATGEVRPAGCLRVRCRTCVAYLAWRRGMAIATCAPERFITLTDVGSTWPQIRRRMKLLRHRLGEAGIEVQWCWTVEVNPRRTGNHVHAYQRGDFVRQDVLSRMARREGMGRVVDIRRWRARTLSAHGYALKALTYGSKGATAQDGSDAFLAMNGERISHQSRRWWPLGRASVQERHAVALWRGTREPEWTVVAVDQVAAYMSAISGTDPYPIDRLLHTPRPDRPF